MLVLKLNEARFRHRVAEEDADILIVRTAINVAKIDIDSTVVVVS